MSEATLIRNEIGKSLRRVVEKTERESRLVQAVIDASASYIVIVDETRHVVFANRAWRQFSTRMGSPAGDYGLGKIYPEMSSGIAAACPKVTSTLRKGIQQIIDGEEIEFRSRYRCTAISEPLWISVHVAAFANSSSQGGRLILISHDDTTAEEFAVVEMRKDEQRLRRLVETTDIVPWERGSGDSKFTYVGQTAVKLLGYSIEEWKKDSFWADHIHPEDRTRVVAEYTDISPLKEHFKSEYRMIAEDGGVVWIEDHVDVVREWSKPPAMHGFITNISERKHAESISVQLSRRLINAQEEERKRIARELHDDLNQRVALISIELEQVAQSGNANPSYLSNRIRSLKQKVSEISNEIHRMSYELHPSKLDHLGLVPALRSFCSELERSRGIKIHFRYEAVPEGLHRDITLCVFRTAQEALQNASKHSGASEVTVTLRGCNRQLELTIADEGCGFLMTEERMTKGLGLTSMQERVRYVGGSFKVTSERWRGTSVHVTVPLSPTTIDASS